MEMKRGWTIPTRPSIMETPPTQNTTHPPPEMPSVEPEVQIFQPETSQAQSMSIFPFNRLPPEIRQLVWAFTFTPRTLHIKIHLGGTPVHGIVSSAAQPWMSPCQLKIACVCFTATNGLIPNSGPRLPSHRIHEYPTWTIHPSMSVPPPPGPAALYVCQESRAVALRHYELAFSGTNYMPSSDTQFAELWQEGGYGEKKIWVNFSIDTIFCSFESRGIFRGIAVTNLMKYAKEELEKIRCLAIDSSYDLGRQKVTQIGPDIISMKRRSFLRAMRNLKLERLVVLHVEKLGPSEVCRLIEESKVKVSKPGSGTAEDSMWSCGMEKVEEEIEMEGERREKEMEREREKLKKRAILGGDIRRELQEERSKCPAAWKGEVPEVEVKAGCFWGYSH